MGRRNFVGEFDIEIERMVFGGYGLGHFDGKAVFVARAYPGEKARVRVFKRKKGVLFAEPIEILKPSPHRRKAPCESFGKCGGCAHQDIEYDIQYEYKVEIVLDALTRLGHLKNIPVPEQIPAENEFRYRNKMEFAFSRDNNGQIFMGQHMRGRFNRFVPAEKCLLMPEIGTEILDILKSTSEEMGLDIYDNRNDTGLLRYAPLRFSHTDGDYICSVTTRHSRPESISKLLDSVDKRVPGMSAGVMVVNERTGDTAVGEPRLLAGKGFIEEEIEGIRFRISPQSFFQTNTEMARVFYRKIIEYAELSGDEKVLDLYCGTGTIARLVARNAGHVIGIDSVLSSIEDAEIGAARDGCRNTTFICNSVKKSLGTVFEDFTPRVVILDPPRGGIAKKTLTRIIEHAPPRIVYASCNPTTLARDLERLTEHYKFERLAIVDMFPQTYHIECVTRLEHR